MQEAIMFDPWAREDPLPGGGTVDPVQCLLPGKSVGIVTYMTLQGPWGSKQSHLKITTQLSFV